MHLLEVTHVTSLQFSCENYVSQGFDQLFLDLAEFCSADFGPGKVFCTLFWVSQGFFQLIFAPAWLFQLILALARFLFS